MKIEVNGTEYEVEIIGEKVRVNNKELRVNLNEDKITIEGRIFHSDFVQDGEPSLMIINSMIYLVSKNIFDPRFIEGNKGPYKWRDHKCSGKCWKQSQGRSDSRTHRSNENGDSDQIPSKWDDYKGNQSI